MNRTRPLPQRITPWLLALTAWLLLAATPAPATATTVSAGYDTSCSVSDTGAAQCWGAMALAKTSTAGIADVRVGKGFGCALLKTGTVSCWGTMGGLSLGAASADTLGTPITGISDAIQLVAGASHACALSRFREVYCWGDGSQGQLGEPLRATPTAEATKVPGFSGTWRIAAGNGSTCAALTIRTVVCVGAGSLLEGAQSDPGKARTVPGIRNAYDVSIFDGHACVLLGNDKVACWGNNQHGELGAPASSGVATSPFDVEGLLGPVKALTAGHRFTCALLANATLQCWGNNANAQLGTGLPYADSQAPTQVVGITEAAEVSAGQGYACTALYGGYVNCWGKPEPLQAMGHGLCDTHIATYPGFDYVASRDNLPVCHARLTGAITPYSVQGLGPAHDIGLVLDWAEKTLPSLFPARSHSLADPLQDFYTENYPGGHTLAVTGHGTPRLFYQGPESGGSVVELGTLAHWAQLAARPALALQATVWIDYMPGPPSPGCNNLFAAYAVRAGTTGFPAGFRATSVRLEKPGLVVDVPVRDRYLYARLTTAADWLSNRGRLPGAPIPPGMMEEPVYSGVAQGCPPAGLTPGDDVDVVLFYTTDQGSGSLRVKAKGPILATS
ncbi:hypothetical protein [Acidovorax sp. Root219]|uniref:RCC1 domain-containing protein n=1 Tax=Acidovorax sp. Root219 TaxID=1736493 RepID=UPI0009E6961D|nr:hypothetical protein [Acidovorax sp. Root219]